MKLSEIRQTQLDYERKCILMILEKHDWNQAAAAETLDCHPMQLRRIIGNHAEIAKKLADVTPKRRRKPKNDTKPT